VAADLAAHGRVRRAYLGIQISGVDRQTGERVEQPGAVQVNGVAPDSPASQAGLIRGDIILSVDGHRVSGPSSLQSATEFAPTDRPLTLAIAREGERKEVRVQPKEQPEAFGLPEPEPQRAPGGRRFPGTPAPPEPSLESTPAPSREPPLESTPAPKRDAGDGNPRETGFRTTDVAFATLGLRLSEPTPELARRHRLSRPDHGLVIVGVDHDGRADRGGLEVGMVITDIGRQRIENLDDFRSALNAHEVRAARNGRSDLVVRIMKGPKAEFRVIPLAADAGAGDAPKSKNEPSSR